MNKQKKMELIMKLLKENHISAEEAVLLYETEKEYIYPTYPITYVQPYTWVSNPPYTITCGSTYTIQDIK